MLVLGEPLLPRSQRLTLFRPSVRWLASADVPAVYVKLTTQPSLDCDNSAYNSPYPSLLQCGVPYAPLILLVVAWSTA
jgi:hypothetical protein